MSRPDVSSFRYNQPQTQGQSAPFPLPRRPHSFSGTADSGYTQPPLPPSLATEGIQTLSDFILSLPHPRYWPNLIFTALVLDPLRALISNVILLVTSPVTHRVVLRLSVLASLFWAALALAILASIGFYRAWVPDVGRVEEVHLQYGRDGMVPSAEIDLTRLRPSGASPGSPDDWFAEEQEYDVTLDLLVPISSANLDLGNFMVSIDLVSADNTVIFHSSRPTILRPSTPSVRFLSQFASQISSRPSIGSIPLPLPFTSPSLEMMTISLFDRLIIHPSPSRIPFSNPPGSPLGLSDKRRVTKAVIKVGREDAQKYWVYGGGHGIGGVVTTGGSGTGAAGENQGPPGMVLTTSNGGAFRSRGELQTVAVGLRFDARLQGLRWFLYEHPILAFLLFTTLFLTFELLSAITLWTIAAVYTSSLPGLDIDLGSDNQFVPRAGGGDDDDDGDGDDDDDDNSTWRRFGSQTPTASSTATSTLRRRGPGQRTSASTTPDPFGGGGGTPTTATITSDEEASDVDADAASEGTITEDAEDVRLLRRGSGGGGSGGGAAGPSRTGTLLSTTSSSPSSSGSSTSATAAAGDPNPLQAPGAGAAADDVLLTPSYRRVLGRLDEETEEETDDVASSSSPSPLLAAAVRQQQQLQRQEEADTSEEEEEQQRQSRAAAEEAVEEEGVEDASTSTARSSSTSSSVGGGGGDGAGRTGAQDDSESQ